MMLRQSPLIILVVLSSISPNVVLADRNIALHRSYTLNPRPNYKACTEEGDLTQLTDGKTFGCWWAKKTTVGWASASTGIEIVIDLGHLSPVDYVRVYTVGGGFADMEFPEFIAVLVSMDGKKYGFAGLVGSEELAHVRSIGHNRVPHTFVIDNLNTNARFVKVVARPHNTNARFFVDEIEVIGKEQRLDGKMFSRKSLLEFDDLEKLLVAIEDYLQLRENIEVTIKVLRNARARFSVDLLKKLSSNLNELAERLSLPTKEIYSRNELFALHKKLRDIRAQIYGEVYKKPFVCFVADPMQMLLAKDMQLVDVSKEQRIDIQLWKDEYESAALNVINCSQESLDMLVSFSPLVSRDGTIVDSRETVTVRRAIFVKALGAGSVADALVLQPEQPFQLQPSEISQIWLTVFNPALTTGDYKGTMAVAVSCGPKKLPIETIELRIRVEDITFPRDVALNTFTWDQYPWFQSVTKDILPVVSDDLEAHYTNVSVLHPWMLPFLKKKARHKDFSRFDRHLQVKNFARMYLLNLAWVPGQKDWGRFGQWMSPSWKQEFSSWLKMMVAHLLEIGIDYDKFAIYPFDESLCDEFYQVAKLIKEIDPKIRIFANNFGKGPKDFMRFKDLIDIWCPHWVHCKAHPEWLAIIKSFGKEVWTYGGEAKAPAKTRPSYGYYRLMAWDAFERGQKGVGFWVYINHDKHQRHAWDDTLAPRGYYGVVYAGAKSPVETYGEEIIPSRRWEAWREGIEDYEYLVQLRKAIDKVRAINPNAAAEAEATLNSQVKRVVSNRANSEIVYSARRIITKTLLQLRQLGH
jgi:hypothetical protein